MKKLKKIVLIAGMILLFTLFVSCKSNEVIKIGFIGSMTGNFSDVGVAGRNAVILKVEEVNASGGINGRKIELMIKDDQGDAEKTLEAIKELNKEGAVVIIGPSLSNNAKEVLPYINENKILIMAGTNSSIELSGMDDFYFRVSQENRQESVLQADFLIEKGQDAIVAILDIRNRSFAMPFYELFKEKYTLQGGKIKKEIIYGHDGVNEKINFSELADDIIEAEAKAIMIVTSAMDTAMIAQQLSRKNYSPFIITSGWAKTQELILQGGNTVEGVYTTHVFDDANESEFFKNFRKKYLERFKVEPIFASNYHYDAANVLFYAIEQSRKLDSESIKQELLKIKDFEGLQGNFSFDQYGDVEREYFMFQVIDGEFVRVE